MWRARGSDGSWTRIDRKMSWSPRASSGQQRARVLTAHARPNWPLTTRCPASPPDALSLSQPPRGDGPEVRRWPDTAQLCAADRPQANTYGPARDRGTRGDGAGRRGRTRARARPGCGCMGRLRCQIATSRGTPQTPAALTSTGYACTPYAREAAYSCRRRSPNPGQDHGNRTGGSRNRATTTQ